MAQVASYIIITYTHQYINLIFYFNNKIYIHHYLEINQTNSNSNSITSKSNHLLPPSTTGIGHACMTRWGWDYPPPPTPPHSHPLKFFPLFPLHPQILSSFSSLVNLRCSFNFPTLQKLFQKIISTKYWMLTSFWISYSVILFVWL